MQRIMAVFLVVCLSVSFTGCAMVTALKHPTKKNLQVLNEGMSRENVLTYLGSPISSEKLENGKRVEIYQFQQGFTKANKAIRATVHVILDVLTLFLWEFLGWPAEVIFKGDQMTVKVTYNENDFIEDVHFLKIEE